MYTSGGRRRPDRLKSMSGMPTVSTVERTTSDAVRDAKRAERRSRSRRRSLRPARAAFAASPAARAHAGGAARSRLWHGAWPRGLELVEPVQAVALERADGHGQRAPPLGRVSVREEDPGHRRYRRPSSCTGGRHSSRAASTACFQTASTRTRRRSRTAGSARRTSSTTASSRTGRVVGSSPRRAPTLDDVQRRIVDDVEREGYSLVAFSDLFPEPERWQELETMRDRFVAETEADLAKGGEQRSRPRGQGVRRFASTATA